MSSIVLQNLFKISSRFFLSMIPHGCKFHMAGIIPGGGLGKLQGIKEEEYFARKDSELFENMSNNKNDLGHALHGHPTYHAVHDCACSVKHKNLLEEAYFLNDNIRAVKMSQIGELGSGAGKGGGGGGSIREAGGSFGKMEAAREEEFFYKQQKEQLKNLKNKPEPQGGPKKQ